MKKFRKKLIVHKNAPGIKPPGEIILNCEREQNFRRSKRRWQSFYILSRIL